MKPENKPFIPKGSDSTKKPSPFCESICQTNKCTNCYHRNDIEIPHEEAVIKQTLRTKVHGHFVGKNGNTLYFKPLGGGGISGITNGSRLITWRASYVSAVDGD